MRDFNIPFSCAQLRLIRGEAKASGVSIPKNLTALRSSARGWWLVEGDGFRKEVVADNAYDAKFKIIAVLVDEAQRKGAKP